MSPTKITRKGNEESSQRYDKAMKNQTNIGNIDAMFKDTKISAEYDTWSWYYTELSGLRAECSRLGLLVRVNDKSSPHFLSIYNAHIISYLNMIAPLIPDQLWDVIMNEWNGIQEQISAYQKQITNVGHRPIPLQLIQRQDNLFRAALKCAQRLGLGFKITLSDTDTQLIRKSILGE